MLGTIAKMLAYKKAPKTTFAVRHPHEAVKARKMQYDMQNAYAPRVAAAITAAIMLPLGICIGYRLREAGYHHHRDYEL